MPARHHRLSAVLAARIGQRQVESVILADRAATAVDRAISSVWRQLLGVLAGPRDWAESYHAALRVLVRLTPAIAAELGERLHGLAEVGHKSSAKLLADTLPLEYLRAAVLTTPARESVHGHAEAPARLDRPRGRLPGPDGAGVRFQAADGLVALSEGEADDLARTVRPGRLAGAGLPDSPRGDVLLPHLLPGVGGLELHAQPAQLSEEDGDGPLDGSRLRVPARVAVPSDDRHGALVHHQDAARLLSEDEAGSEPAEAPRTDEQWKEIFERLLFPPPPLELLQRIVFAPTSGQPWTERISSLSRLAPPEVLASLVANGMAAGKTQRDIAQEILPQVNGVRASAARVARTEGVRVLHAVQQRCHDSLGDLILAYQVHSVHDHWTRSWHAARSGTVYYRDPKPGQKGPEQQPNPPAEANDPAERPPGTPATAPNCRCWLTPVLRPSKEIMEDPAKMAVFQTNAGKVVPDPSSFSDWFARADVKRQRLAVGARKHAWATQEFGKDFGWELFITPEGRALTLKGLKAESDKRRGERIAKVRAVMAQRKKLTTDVATYGFLPMAS